MTGDGVEVVGEGISIHSQLGGFTIAAARTDPFSTAAVSRKSSGSSMPTVLMSVRLVCRR
jgi:hypothetical protein